MKKLAFVAAIATLVGCQQDTKNLEKKLDDIQKDVVAIKGAIAKGGGAAGAAQQRPRRPEPDRAKTYAMPIDGDGFVGAPDAKVTIVKAYDYACPYCEKVRGTMDELLQKYGKDVRVVYKQMVVHPGTAMAGALAYCAANLQGKGHEMDVALWDKGFKARVFDQSAVAGAEKGAPAGQKCWDTADGCKNVVRWAQEIGGINVDKFKADMKGSCQQLVQKDMSDLQKLGVGATPSFFINGRFLSGAMPTANFATLVDEELKKANERIQSGTPAAQYYNQWVLAKGQKTL